MALTYKMTIHYHTPHSPLLHTSRQSIFKMDPTTPLKTNDARQTAGAKIFTDEIMDTYRRSAIADNYNEKVSQSTKSHDDTQLHLYIDSEIENIPDTVIILVCDESQSEIVISIN